MRRWRYQEKDLAVGNDKPAINGCIEVKDKQRAVIPPQESTGVQPALELVAVVEPTQLILVVGAELAQPMLQAMVILRDMAWAG